MEFGQQFRNLRRELGSFSCPKAGTWDRLFYFPSEGMHAAYFSSRKNPTGSVGREPALLGTRGPHANPLTTDPTLKKKKKKKSVTGHQSMLYNIPEEHRTTATPSIFIIYNLIRAIQISNNTKIFPTRTGDVVHSVIPDTDNSFHHTAISLSSVVQIKQQKIWQYLFGKHRHFVPRVIRFYTMLGELATKMQKICIETFFLSLNRFYVDFK
jgi:hypothetical protein